MLSLAENFESADANPPPNFTYSGSVQARFGAAEQSACAYGDYAACISDFADANNPNSPQWFAITANGGIVLATVVTGTPPQFKSNTRLAVITDGTSSTFLAGEKHIPMKMFGHPKVGDGPLYSGAWTSYAGRIAGLEDPLARGPSDLTPSVSGDGFWRASSAATIPMSASLCSAIPASGPFQPRSIRRICGGWQSATMARRSRSANEPQFIIVILDNGKPHAASCRDLSCARTMVLIVLAGVAGGCGGGLCPIQGKLTWKDGSPATELANSQVVFEQEEKHQLPCRRH